MSPTAAKAKRSSMVQRIKAEAEELYEHVEQILFVEVENAEQVTSDQWVLLRSAGITTPHELNKQLGRVQGVKRAMRIAGTPAEYQKAKENFAAAEAAVMSELPTIQEQIQALEARKLQIEEAMTAAEMDIEERDEHRRVLRERQMLPPWVARDRDLAISRLNKGFSELGDLRNKVELGERSLAPTTDEETFGRLAVALTGEEFADENWQDKIAPELHEAAAQAIESQLKQNQESLVEMEAEYAAELAEIEAEFGDFYIRQL